MCFCSSANAKTYFVVWDAHKTKSLLQDPHFCLRRTRSIAFRSPLSPMLWTGAGSLGLASLSGTQAPEAWLCPVRGLVSTTSKPEPPITFALKTLAPVFVGKQKCESAWCHLTAAFLQGGRVPGALSLRCTQTPGTEQGLGERPTSQRAWTWGLAAQQNKETWRMIAGSWGCYVISSLAPSLASHQEDFWSCRLN